MLNFIVKTVFFCVLVNFSAKAETEEELKKLFVDVLMQCAAVNPPTPAEMELLKEKKIGDSENIRCMFACVYKKTGMMDEKGELSVEKIKSLSEKYFAGNPEKIKKALAYVDACKSVNDEKVTDGEKGCQRAALIFKCTVEKGAEFDISD